MDQKTIIAIIIFFALIVLGMFGYTYLKQTEIQDTVPEEVAEPEPEVAYASITRIDGTHYFIDGVHTVVGELLMPTPCDLVETSATVTPGAPDLVTLQFEVINNADMCAQVLTPQRFMVSAEAGADAAFRAVFVGRDVELNLIPAPAGETPEDFELFIKG